MDSNKRLDKVGQQRGENVTMWTGPFYSFFDVGRMMATNLITSNWKWNWIHHMVGAVAPVVARDLQYKQ